MQLNQVKPRLLFCSEFSQINTGFGKINKEVISTIFERKNVEIAEFASCVHENNPLIRSVPWKVYPVITDRPEIKQRETSTPFHQVYHMFGSAMFEYALLDFMPDVVFCDTDRWMSSSYQLMTPFRKLFKYYLCPTCDGLPQRILWLDEYRKVDKLFSYTDFSKNLLEKECPRLVVKDILRPGVNPKKFFPVENKEELKKSLGLPENSRIVLTVMRNQKRKLFPDLIEGFDLYLKRCVESNNEELAKNTYLYLHTSLTDVGYDIQRLVMERGLGHKVLTTYLCGRCKGWYPSFLKTEQASCYKCGAIAAQTCSTAFGIDDEQLNFVYNLGDIYAQYSISEGLSCTASEAKSCGLPVMTVDYSAMSDHAKEPGGIEFKIKDYTWETVVETEQCRALPDKEDFAKVLFNWMKKPKEELVKFGLQGREHISKNYSYERAALLLEKAILEDSFVDHSLTWLKTSANNCPLNTNPPEGLNNSDFVDWCIRNICGQEEWIDSVWRDEFVKALDSGSLNLEGTRQLIQFNRQICITMLSNRSKEHNYFESMRVSKARGQQVSSLIECEAV